MGLLPKDIEILPPYDDRIFKKIMTAPEAKPTLLLVASEIIKRPVVSVLLRNNELPVSDTLFKQGHRIEGGIGCGRRSFNEHKQRRAREGYIPKPKDGFS
jgi:hypothetical protein